ncbi:ABC transporter substrate-binding protein [Effusibacillus lacus]|uniref:Sugar ABC transporter substrate-binding protein n=1 Tax=Effusibacillus lacus TaxID=1348429 RepID=A0A292YKV4_9BACL|nr:extracellular solute-binding protein [Effusibacillus lacus]TCS75872.1 carbohydrate ABC transporter substrate-binding protein (CUT1 family) [Effusibacillus lacus]GAX91737.1 sugar ABC transporter substrate-binding protein [Effusibacillus lacus]
MKNSSKLMAASLAVAMTVAGIAGCSSKDAGTNAGGEKKENVKLTMTSWRVEDTKQYEKIIEEFKKANPGIDIEFKAQKATEYDTILDTALKGGQAADIIQLRPYSGATKIADAGYLEPLDSLKGISNIDASYYEAAKGSDGKIYGIPLSTNTTQIYYNKKLFEKAGVSVPKTWDELVQVAKTLKEKKITPFALGAKDGWILSLTHATIGPDVYGGKDFVQKVLKGETNFKDAKFVDSIKRFNDLTPYFPENFTGLSATDGQALFFTEQAAMYIGGSFDLQPIRDKNKNLDFDFFPCPPASSGGKGTITTWVDGSFGVNKNSKHKAEAMKFMEFMTTKEFGQLFADNLGRVSAVKGVTPKDPMVKKMAEYSETIGTPYMILIHFAQGNPSTKKTLENELQGMFLKQATPEQVAQKVQESANSWFKPKK